jgi:hypothetical protein
VSTSFRPPAGAAVRANSKAVLRPMPDDAPVITTVFPARRFATADDILREVVEKKDE